MVESRKVEDLHLRNLTKRFGDFVAVDDLTLTIPAGSFFALLGPSGCGKTTTLRMVAGLEDPSEGSISIGEQDVTGLRAFKRPVNTVFQSYALFPHLDIFENVAFGLRRRGVKDIKPAVEAMLELVELTPMARRKPKQLSGGQQQRVAVARALINEPEVLLLDEPLGALDLKLRRQMQIELKRIQMEVGTTFVHVTHDQEEAMDMADTVAVMNQGHIEQMGAPEALYDRPKTAFVAKFLGQSNLFVGEVAEADDAKLAINFKGNRLAAPAARVEKTKGKVAIGVRPEKTSFHPEKPASDPAVNTLGPGTITDIRFTGVSNQYQIEIPDVGEITVFAQNVGKSPVVELGAEVWVSWKVEHSFGLADLPTGEEEVAE